MSKILNVCLYGPVTDGWSYQDNLLPKYQKENGHDVTVVTSKWIWDNKGELVKTTKTDYYNEYGIRTIRLDIVNDKRLSYKFKKFERLDDVLKEISPDVIFVHCFQFLDIITIIKYAKEHTGVKVYVDNHCDFSNSATSWLSKNVLHKIIWRSFARKLNPYVTKFYGVIPARVDFLVNMYGLPKEKVELLEMGADDEKVVAALNQNKIKQLREINGIEKDDFLIVTGGKIDKAKWQTLLLMDAVKQLKEKYSIKLIVFGSVDHELKKDVIRLSDDICVKYIGWINPDESYDYFAAADLVVFPGRHSVFWEQVVGIGKPIITKYWDGTTHIQVNGNARFLYKDTVEEMVEMIDSLLADNKKNYELMLERAQGKARNRFLYRYIAARSVDDEIVI